MKIKIPDIAAAEVEAIVFDLGGVILDVDLQRSVEALKALNAEGVGVQDVLAENASVFRDLELGLVTPEAFVRAFREYYPAARGVSDAGIWDAWNAMLMPFDAERVELLRGLGRQGRVFLLSNTNLPHRIRFRELFRERFGGSFDALFAQCFYSDELHLRKPDPEIFRQVAAQIGTAPGHMLFIDDNAADIAAARSEGWQVCHLTGGKRITDLFEL